MDFAKYAFCETHEMQNIWTLAKYIYVANQDFEDLSFAKASGFCN